MLVFQIHRVLGGFDFGDLFINIDALFVALDVVRRDESAHLHVENAGRLRFFCLGKALSPCAPRRLKGAYKDRTRRFPYARAAAAEQVSGATGFPNPSGRF
jgi:hypothetical protein